MKKILTASLSVIGILCVGCNMVSSGTNTTNAEQSPSKANSADWKITARVKAKIAVTLPSASVKVSVTTKDGVVTLIGTVPTQEEKNLIMDAAKKAQGVKSVNVDQLTVGP